jgi:hypothetical protein
VTGLAAELALLPAELAAELARSRLSAEGLDLAFARLPLGPAEGGALLASGSGEARIAATEEIAATEGIAAPVDWPGGHRLAFQTKLASG